MNYYNEIDAYCAEWLRNLIAEGLIPDGHVDERSIEDVGPSDLDGYAQCHFFAGIGGWSYALSLAGWPADEPVWTGSCPCQFASSAAAGNNVSADLFPIWFELVARVRPGVVFGEQVPDKRWTDNLCDSFEGLGYAVSAAILPAGLVGADHRRERLYFESHADGYCQPRRGKHEKAFRVPRAGCERNSVALEDGVSPRMAVMRAYGNAIVPQVAAEFIGAYMDIAALEG